MTKVKLVRNPNGQIKVLEGEVELIGEDGQPIKHGEKFSICGCGRSESILCDGKHKLTEEEYQTYLNSKI